MSGEFGLERFARAQNEGGIYDTALSELRRGRKTSHWMWFVFPQIAGLGRSEIARTYAISSVAEARAYLGHPVLGPRLLECCQALLDLSGLSAEDVMGGIDAVKLRSSMTLFHRADPAEPVFSAVLDAYFGGVADQATDDRLGS
jgi:uncharacterized protein (DUF1810 family)